MNSLIDVFRQLVLLRVAEEELANLFLRKKIFSFIHFYVGQEAVAVGVSTALSSSDYALGNHRSHGHYLAKGGNLRQMFCEILGKVEGSSSGKGGSMHMIDRAKGFMGSSPILGSITSIAAGSAFVQKHNKLKNVTVAYIGDGASEEGGFYETLNLAALFKLPLMIVIENNLYSVNSKILDRRSPAYSSEKIVNGFGLAYSKADGNNVQDVYEKSRHLLRGVRNGQPAVLECEVFRHMAHSAPLFDDAQGYRDIDPPNIRAKSDCITNLREQLVMDGISEKKLDDIINEVRNLVLQEINYAMSSSYPEQTALFSDFICS